MPVDFTTPEDNVMVEVDSDQLRRPFKSRIIHFDPSRSALHLPEIRSPSHGVMHTALTVCLDSPLVVVGCIGWYAIRNALEFGLAFAIVVVVPSSN